MAAYYNEFDPYAAQWLRNLIAGGLIAPGDVDERSITEVSPDDLKGYTQCHFFAGIGGWSFALRRAGWVDERPVWTGSCPCQPFSNNGKRQGFEDPRHLWPTWKRLIEKRRPTELFGEQVSSQPEWLKLVRSDLVQMDYAMAAIPIEAASAGADHRRERYWIVASDTFGRIDGPERTQCDVGDVQDGDPEAFEWIETSDGRKFRNKPGLSWVGHGIPRRSHKIRAFGNAIDIRPATAFIRAVMQSLP